MAEPVIVPVQLEVTDIDTSNANWVDVQKEISKSMAGVKKSINDTFKGIDASAINKPIEKSMTAIEQSVNRVEDAYSKLTQQMLAAGKSSKEYKGAVAEIDSQIKGISETTESLKMYKFYAEKAAKEQLDLGNEAEAIKWAKTAVRYGHEIDEAKSRMDELQAARNKINPIEFVDKADSLQLEKIANAYKKVLSATENVNKQSEKFNETVNDNKLTDEYADMLKQAEAYKKKLEDLDKKSKKMEILGATDKQWEALHYDTDQASLEMDKLIKKMREAVTTGRAFRFGEGNRGELSRQINSLAMSVGNRAGNIKARATNNQSPFTDDYQKSLDELDKLEKKIEKIQEKSAKMVELGASKKQFESLAYDAEQLDIKVDEVKNHLMGMVNEGGAFKFGAGDAEAEIGRLRDKSNALQTTLASVSMVSKQAQGGIAAIGATHPKLAAVLTVANKIATGFANVIAVAAKVGKVIVKGFVGAAKVLGKVASGIIKIGSGFVNLGKRIFGAIKNINLFGKSGRKTTTDMNTRFKKLGKNILMWGLGFRTAYYAIKRLRTIFVDNFKVMGDTFDEVGQPMMRMMEAFNKLKGSLATAFQPLVSVVMPILTTFMNYLSAALEAIGRFNAALTGQGYIYKAVAKNIDSVSDSAKEANKQLGSYDKLEVIQNDNGDNNNTGVEYEKELIQGGGLATDLAQMVKEAWANADFTAVGQFITEKLLGVLDNVEKNILPKVTGFVNRLLKSINTFIDGFGFEAIGDKLGSLINTIVSGLDWAQLGMLFANLNNLVWRFFDGLANGIDWVTLGKSIATGITSMFATLDLNAWVGMISGFVTGITTALYNALTNVDWASVAVILGNSVNNLFKSINLAQIGVTIRTLFDSIWTLIGNFFATVDFEMIASNIANGINAIFSGDSSAFNSAIPSIANGLVTFLVTAIEQIDWDAILDTLIGAVDKILDALGTALMNSNNPMLSAFGEIFLSIKDVIAKLIPAIGSLLSALGPIILSILPVISELLPPLAEILAEAVELVLPLLVGLFVAIMPILSELVEILLPLIFDLLESLQPIFDALIDTILPVLVHLLDALMPLVESILNLVVDLISPLLELLGPLLEIVFDILDPLITILEPIIDILAILCDVIGDILRPILEALRPILSAVSSLFKLLSPIIEICIVPIEILAGVLQFVAGIITGVVVTAVKILTGIIEVLSGVVEVLANVFKKAFEAIGTAVQKVVGVVKKPINAILGFIETLANGVINCVNNIVRALNALSFDVPDWVPGLGGQKFGFNLRELGQIKIPRLAQGAVIPPNKEFLAMLGDQTHGTNIEAPLDTIKQALAEVLAEVGGGTREPIVLEVNGRTLAKVVWDEQEKRYKQTGKYAMA